MTGAVMLCCRLAAAATLLVKSEARCVEQTQYTGADGRSAERYIVPEWPDWLHTPNLDTLAARSTRFANAYTASPLCAPGRASFMSGLLPSRTRVYDNNAEFASAIPTYAHHLHRAGYYTCLSGKCILSGPISCTASRSA